jgi:molybdopterin converting factor subunit 1
MFIKTLFFGIVRDITSNNTIDMEVDDDIHLEQFVVLLQEKFTGFPNIDDFTIAVNEEYVEKDFILKANDVVAIIPPVSGG